MHSNLFNNYKINSKFKINSDCMSRINKIISQNK